MVDDSRPEGTAQRSRLLVLVPGIGAVGTTFIAGLVLATRGRPAIGSLAETLRVPTASAGERPVRDLVELVPLDQIRVAGWDIHAETADAVARRCAVLTGEDLTACEETLAQVRIRPGVFSARHLPRLPAPNRAPADGHLEAVDRLRNDIRELCAEHQADRAVMIWCGSTERVVADAACHRTVEAFAAGLRQNDRHISPAQLYAWAAVSEGVPYADISPNRGTDLPALQELAVASGVPLAGRDLKTGQTLLKVALAGMFARRALGVRGWYSLNLLGNRDGEVLRDGGSRRAKTRSKGVALASLLDGAAAPELYEGLAHEVDIRYYPLRGDAKESWDVVDFLGWLGYPMQLRIHLLGRDSILAAPLVLDLALWLDLAQRTGWSGLQSWLGLYFKDPQMRPPQVHDLAAQHDALVTTIRELAVSSAVGRHRRPAEAIPPDGRGETPSAR